jgi:ketosteroid isomerase-like protein
VTRPAVAALLLCAAPLLADPPAPTRPADEEAVRKVLAEQVTAWNKGDLDGFMAGYWNDEKLTYISGGKYVRGWKALRERYRVAYQAEGKEMGKLAFADLDTEAVGPGAVLVRGKWQLTVAREEVGGWFTLLFRKFPDGWKVTHDHTSK